MERFLEYFEPEKYILDLEVDKGRKTIGGVVTVLGTAKVETVKFHAVGLSVSSVLVNGEKADFEARDGVLSVFKAPRSEIRVEIGYEGSLNENMQGAYLSTYEYQGRTETIVATQFESHYAREAFPCIDEPAAKAVFELSITVPDEDDMVLSNMPAVSETPRLGHAQGRSPKLTVLDEAISETTTHHSRAQGRSVVFEPTPRISTYLLAFVIGKFQGKTVKNAHGTEITTYCSLAQDADAVDFANEVAAKSLEFYDDNFGVKYPLKKLDQVALPDFEAGAMENWGLVTYRESMMLAGKNATLGTKKSVALTVAHELSHQWFGDLVTMKWWDDLWLNESFASVMEYYAVDQAYPEFKIFEGFFTGDCLSALMRDAYSGVQSVHQDVSEPAEIATLFDGAIVYSKGARLMLMLIRAMGWTEFCRGIRDYFEKFKYQNTVGDDLWARLSRHAEFDVGAMMHAFIDRPGYPVITAGKQQRFLLDGKMTSETWPIAKISEDMSGHYVLNLSEKEFRERLARFDELNLEEKLRLLIDRSLVCWTELASSASLLPLVEKFRDENSAAVWNIVAIIVGQLKIFCEPDSEEEKKLKKFVGELVRPKLTEIGLITRAGDDENVVRLRAILLGLDYYAEDTENLKVLAELYTQDFAKIDAEIRDAVLDAKIYFEPEMVEEFLTAYRETADPDVKFDLLFATTLARDEKVLTRMVEVLNDVELVKPQDQLHLFIYLFRNSRARKMVWQWLTSHWDFVKKMMGDKSLDAYPRYTANVIRTGEGFEAWREFFEPMREDPALKRAIEIGENEIVARLELIKSDREEVFETLAKTSEIETR
jgi:aminopeptidase N